MGGLAFAGCMALIYYDDQFLTGTHSLHQGETLHDYNDRMHREYATRHEKCFTDH